MKTTSFSLALLFSCLPLVTAPLAKAVDDHDLNVDLWTNSWATITRLEPVDGGYVWIRLNGRTDYGCATAPNATYGYIVRVEDNGRDILYSTLVAAFMSGKPIRVMVKSNGTSTTECAVKKIRVGS